MDESKINEMCRLIRQLREAALKLKAQGEGIQAVERNVERILASTKMLELNVSDVAESSE
ncbi:MAG: hypothetical protein DRN37_00710 [Thermoplasmata archaeon]|nr:MAG: hypothetical protein DRN37_00710 [Thermoplasmata archaeon]